MTRRIARRQAPGSGWRTLAALVAVVAVASLVHWHPLVENSGSETLRGSANQCVACTTGNGTPAVSFAVSLILIPIARAVAAPPSAPPASPVLRAASPRAPPV